MKNETKKELLENWYLWLERRIRPNAPKGSAKVWIKAALDGYNNDMNEKDKI